MVLLGDVVSEKFSCLNQRWWISMAELQHNHQLEQRCPTIYFLNNATALSSSFGQRDVAHPLESQNPTFWFSRFCFCCGVRDTNVNLQPQTSFLLGTSSHSFCWSSWSRVGMSTWWMLHRICGGGQVTPARSRQRTSLRCKWCRICSDSRTWNDVHWYLS